MSEGYEVPLSYRGDQDAMKIGDGSVQVSLKYTTRGVVNAGGVDSNSSFAAEVNKKGGKFATKISS